MSVNRDVLVKTLQEQMKIAKTDAKELVSDFFDLVSLELSNGNEVNLRGFGKFKLVEKKERVGRNPKSLESHTIEAKRVCVFKRGKMLKLASQVLAEEKSIKSL